MCGNVFQIRRFSTHDGPGIRTTVFLKGCPLECTWCHNPEGQSSTPELLLFPERCIACGACLAACPAGAAIERTSTDRILCTACGGCVEVCTADARTMAGEEMSVEEVMAVVDRDIPFYRRSGGGVSFSGGEPAAQPEFLSGLLSACVKSSIHTCLDTSGACEPEVFDLIQGMVDLYLYDVKLPDDPRSIDGNGLLARWSLPNLRRLCECGQEVILRYVVIPGISDGRERALRLAGLVHGLHGDHPVELLPYHDTWTGKLVRLGRGGPPEELPVGGGREALDRFRRVLTEEGVIVS